MIKISVKPMSINKAYKGKRFRTKEYDSFEKIVLYLLPKINIPKPPYEIYFKFGFSSTSSDWDNCIKITQDILAKKYNFNDKLIKKGIVETEQVKKGQEYFEFEIKQLKL